MEWIASGGTVESFYKEYTHLPNDSVEEATMFAANSEESMMNGQ